MPKAKHNAHPAAVKAKTPAKRARSKAEHKPHHARTHRPIELYFWPTYNGLKISIMLEECELPYVIKGININRGEQFDEHFLSISPNNRIPAIVDPDGPGGKPISIFESGAILQYLGRKTGKFYPKEERARVEVDQWLFWQCAGFGPMAGQAHHFREYAAEQIHYAIDRYTNEMNRLYGVMNKRLVHSDFLAGEYSIADMACWGVVKSIHRQGQTLEDFPNVNAWWERMNARLGVQRGSKAGEYLRKPDYQASKDPIAAQHLFGQTARS
jgi:glutathione S-transferase